jgi:hypothetical protein
MGGLKLRLQGRSRHFATFTLHPESGYDGPMSKTAYVDDAVLGAMYPEHIQTVQSRHDQALERAGANHAVIFSGAPRTVFLDDYDYPFKPIIPSSQTRISSAGSRSRRHHTAM